MQAPNSPPGSLLSRSLSTVVGTLRGLTCFHLCLRSLLLAPHPTSLSHLLSGICSPQSWCFHALHEFLPLGGFLQKLSGRITSLTTAFKRTFFFIIII